MNADLVTIGSEWLGASGNVLVVTDVHEDRACIAYVDDPSDTMWETKADIVSTFSPVRLNTPGATTDE